MLEKKNSTRINAIANVKIDIKFKTSKAENASMPTTNIDTSRHLLNINAKRFCFFESLAKNIEKSEKRLNKKTRRTAKNADIAKLFEVNGLVLKINTNNNPKEIKSVEIRLKFII